MLGEVYTEFGLCRGKKGGGEGGGQVGVSVVPPLLLLLPSMRVIGT